MPEFLEPNFLWPTLPATIMVIAACGYWLLVILGAMAPDALDFDFDFDADTHGSILDLGYAPLRFLNLGQVPVMVWASIFSLCAWITSQVVASYGEWPKPHETFEFSTDTLAIMRDFTAAALITKLVTNPMRGLFDLIEPIRGQELVGESCVITTGEATETFGEANVATGAAPISLTVRVTDGTLKKSDVAEIVEYVPEENIYYVKRANQEV